MPSTGRRNAVVVIADEKQFPPAVFLVQRLRRLNQRPDVDVILAATNRTSLAEASAFDSSLTLLDLSEVGQNANLPVAPGYITRATYLRLFLPVLLAKSHRRILYLDVDVYPETAKLFDLFDMQMRAQAVAAVRDLNVSFIANEFNSRELATTLKSVALGAKYFNGGVTLFDVDVFVEKRLEKKAFALLADAIPRPQLMDQTILNALLKGNWLELSPAFNMITRAWSSFIRQFVPPAIIHFTGNVKPWHQGFQQINHPVKTELAAFLKDSPWPAMTAAEQPPNSTVAPWGSYELAAIASYLRDTPFADVKQGLTKIEVSALPIAR